MKDSLFLDTNILAYYLNTSSQFNNQVMKNFQVINEKYELWISRQILREYAVVISRPGFSNNIADSETIADDLVRWESNLNIADENEEVTRNLIYLIRQYKISGKKIHDANIVATMLTYRLPVLYTYNQDDFKRFKEIELYTAE